jgi:hypothetical protein
MPLHDWTRVPAGLYHDFHQSWSIRIKDSLNSGLLPKGLSALVEQHARERVPDVLTIESFDRTASLADGNGGVATMAPPVTRIVRRTAAEAYAEKANRIVIRHHLDLDQIVAVIEIVSPGNKDGRGSFRAFVEKTVEFLKAGIHVLIVDPFPPTRRDPFGIHKAVWDELKEEDFEFPEGKDRILVSYQSLRSEYTAYVEPVAVGDELPDMPLFLARELHIKVPLESTNQATWEATPEALREAVETGVVPDVDVE